jgi:cyclic pyranopterin phosphate synthase
MRKNGREKARKSPSALTHFDARGSARMVDVGDKDITHRVAVASGRIAMRPATFRLVLAGRAKKGDVLGVARIAAIQAAKRTAELIPLCHPLPLSHLDCDVRVDVDEGTVRLTAQARTVSGTGVEMEALTAAAVAALTVYDMVKGVEKGVTVEQVALLDKTGGRSGDWHRDD